MSAISIPSVLYGSSLAALVSDLTWKLTKFKDLSAGGACETGYGDQTKLHRTLQQLSDFKHNEKHTPPLGWAATLIPALLDAVPKIFYHDKKLIPVRDIPGRAHAVFKEKTANLSARQLGYLISIIPLNTGARALKNHIWPGNGFDPSGHTMFKITQYGMMLSIATDHGTKPRLSTPVVFYLAVTAIADSVMLGNTIANCHTLAEIVAGAGIGIVVLLTADLVSKHTPLGALAKSVSKAAGELVNEVGNNLMKGRDYLLKQILA